MKHILLITLISLASLSQSAQAADAGGYFGAGLATSSISTTCADGWFTSCYRPSSNPKSGGFVRIVGGFNFNKHFGFEMGYSDLGTYKVHNSSNVNQGEFKASAVTFAVRGGNIFSNGFSIFGKFGLASVKTQYTVNPSWTLVGDTDQRTSGYVLGVAGQYDLNEAIGFRVSMEAVKYTDSEFNAVIYAPSLMAVFKF